MIKPFTAMNLKYARPLNEQGFTLIEVLFSLMIFSTIIYLIAPIIQIAIENTQTDAQLQSMEWEVFSNEIKQEIRMSTQADVIYDKLYVTKDGVTITYDKYGNNIRRRVNFNGHEIVLQNVSKLSFIRTDQHIKIEVTDVYGNHYDVVVHAFVEWKPS
ncbi:competence type IV pilus minor pilin ComGF [Neobacillus sp. LXY-1]|uniref:competence type IV pilus minor pilin ComGF n=1 Tax=Neobacillus sp. LXY-1 TaxID=3379133 RepID=UPI003EE19D9A